MLSQTQPQLNPHPSYNPIVDNDDEMEMHPPSRALHSSSPSPHPSPSPSPTPQPYLPVDSGAPQPLHYTDDESLYRYQPGLQQHEHSYNPSYASSVASFDPYSRSEAPSVRGLIIPPGVGGAGPRVESPLIGAGTQPYLDDAFSARSGGGNSGGGFFPPVRSGTTKSRKKDYYQYTKPHSKRRPILIYSLIGVAAVAIAAAIVVYFAVIKKHSSSSSSSSASSSGSSPNGNNGTAAAKLAVTGGDGSTVTMDDGSTFTYTNKFGGYWYADPDDPFKSVAQAQSWSPALNETFNWGVDKIRGVNIGGWLVTEPFITPALYEKYYNVTPPLARPIDEWTLSLAMSAANNISELSDHYATFITEQDFAQIAAAGLNFVRIPIPYWAIEIRTGEAFLPKEQWGWFLKAVEWCRKYGIRINLDLHSVPGSQNGWNHSGRLGSINFLYGPAGIFNAQRTLSYIQTITEFISQPQYSSVIVMFGILNEPRSAGNLITQTPLAGFYLEAIQTIRNITGVGQGNGPFISIHDGFEPLNSWVPIMTGADRVALDTHPYVAFNSPQLGKNPQDLLTVPCTYWGNSVNGSLQNFGLTTAGEFSIGINDCGEWLNGVDLGSLYDGTHADSPPAVGSCDPWNNYQTWDNDLKQGFKGFALSSMDALQNWFFWTWKIGNSTITGSVGSPMWSYSLGLQEGWMPTDPREAEGQCAGLGAAATPFNPPLQPSQTGGQGAGSIPASNLAAYPFPPTSIQQATDVSLLAVYTPTGAISTLSAPTFSPSPTASGGVGNGWFDASDTVGMYVPISGCSYPTDAWGGTNIPQPSAACGGPGQKVKRDDAYEATVTPAPTPAPRRR